MSSASDRNQTNKAGGSDHGEANSSGSSEIGPDSRTTGQATTENYESHWPTIRKWLGTPNPTEPCPLIQCGVCYEEVLLREGTFDLFVPPCQSAGCDCGFRPPPAQEVSTNTQATKLDRTVAYNPLPLTGRETDNAVWLGCCGNLIGLRCLLATTRNMHLPAGQPRTGKATCPFCRRCLSAHWMNWAKFKVSEQGMCVLCQESFAEPADPSNRWVTRFEEGAATNKSWTDDHVYEMQGCRHKFCRGCIERWVADSRAYSCYRCPICRANLARADVDALQTPEEPNPGGLRFSRYD